MPWAMPPGSGVRRLPRWRPAPGRAQARPPRRPLRHWLRACRLLGALDRGHRLGARLPSAAAQPGADRRRAGDGRDTASAVRTASSALSVPLLARLTTVPVTLAAPAVGPLVGCLLRPLPARRCCWFRLPLPADGAELLWPPALAPVATAFPFFTTQFSGALAFWHAVGYGRGVQQDVLAVDEGRVAAGGVAVDVGRAHVPRDLVDLQERASDQVDGQRRVPQRRASVSARRTASS